MGSQFFFVVDDEQAKFGKKLFSILGLILIAANLFAIYQNDQHGRLFQVSSSGLYIVSFGVFWWAIKTNKSQPLRFAFSGQTPPNFVKEGPYRIVRHPFYFSYSIAWLAGGLAGHWSLLIPALVMIGLYIRAARIEEASFFKSSFSAEYKEYCKTTGMFFPKIWR